MSNKKRLCLFIIIFLLIFVFIVEPLNHLNRSVDSYTKKYSNADVLVIGSSHAYCNISAATLWHEYGITSSFIGQGEQPISFSYEMLKSSLRYAKPKLVILEAYMVAAGNNTSYDTDNGQYINALLGYPIYKNLDCRIEAAKRLDAKYKLPYIVGFPNWDSSYNYFDGMFGDVYDSVGCQYLTGYNKDDQWPEYWSTGKIEKYDEISNYSEEYFLKISKLCEKNNIPLLCLITPYQMSSEHAARINTAKKLAEENNIDFIDMNDHIDEMNIDLSTEMVNWGHTLVTASDKGSRWLAPILINKYELRDRRDDLKYSAWNDCYEYYLNKKKKGISENDFETCLRILANDETLTFSVSMKTSAYEHIKKESTIMQFMPESVQNLPENNEYDAVVIAFDSSTGEEFARNCLNFDQ